jgi:hypothetical protein
MSPPDRQALRYGRLLATLRLGWAATLLGLPRPLLRLVGGDADPRSVKVARILGGRHAIQGVIELTTWPQWRRLEASVDGLHAVTALGFAGIDARRRHVAIYDAVVAGTIAAAGLVRPGAD